MTYQTTINHFSPSNEETYLHEVDQHIFNDPNGTEYVIGKGICFIEGIGLTHNLDLDTLLDDTAAMSAFVKLVSSLKGEPRMLLCPTNPKISAKHLNLLRGMAQIVTYYDLLASKLTFHPYIEAVMQLDPSDWGYLTHYYYYYQTQAQKSLTVNVVEYSILSMIVFNYLKIVKSETTRKRIDNIQRGVRENTDSIDQQFKALLKKHASLLVIRVDLSYETRLKDVNRLTHISREQISEDKKYFLKEIERQFPDWLGYVCKLEFAPKKGYHYHCILYFNGNELRADGVISLALARLWRDITSERKGVTFLCNLHKKEYTHLAIGRVHYTEKEKIKNFRYVAQYLAKNDLFSCIKKNGKRSLEKSQVKARETNRGRPRITT